MSEIDPAASSESGSDLLVELARQKERIARLESLLAETNRRVDNPKTSQGERPRPKTAGNSAQAPARLSELGPQLQGFAQAVMAYSAPKEADPPPKTHDAMEPTIRMTHERRQPAYSPQTGKPRGPGRGGLMALLVSGALLIVMFAGAGVLYNHFLASDLDSAPSPASKHYQPVPRDPVEPPEVLPVEQSPHMLANRPPTIAILPEKRQGNAAESTSPTLAPPPTAEQKPVAGLHSARRHHPRHRATVRKPEPSRNQPARTEARRPESPPALLRAAQATPRAPARKPTYRTARRSEPSSLLAEHHRIQIALAGISVEHKHAFQPSPAPKRPPMRAAHHTHSAIAARFPRHAHPGYDEKADAWMDRLP